MRYIGLDIIFNYIILNSRIANKECLDELETTRRAFPFEAGGKR
jgi:hypothetical protein